MARIARKFAVPLNTSVRKETRERAEKLLQQYRKIAYEKLKVDFSMSDLSELSWNTSLPIMEKWSNKLIEALIRDMKLHQNKTLPPNLAQLTDKEIKSIEARRPNNVKGGD